jgi:hypothetical protein
MIPDPEGVRDYKTRLAQLKNNYDEFLLAKVREHVNKIIVDEIISKMQKENFSPKIYQNTYLKDVKLTNRGIKANIVSVYFTASGFDVAIAREKGTKGHFIKPNTAQALSWITQGVRLFSKGHWVSGIKSLKIIQKTIKEKKPEVQQAIEREFEQWMVRVFTE